MGGVFSFPAVTREVISIFKFAGSGPFFRLSPKARQVQQHRIRYKLKEIRRGVVVPGEFLQDSCDRFHISPNWRPAWEWPPLLELESRQFASAHVISSTALPICWTKEYRPSESPLLLPGTTHTSLRTLSQIAATPPFRLHRLA